ncbi:hypothetical protein [Burkholderia ubonensis]|nr:hypothetical protein [Burkholderia ubonensis]
MARDQDGDAPCWLLHVLTEMPLRAADADISDLLPFNYAKRQSEASVS